MDEEDFRARGRAAVEEEAGGGFGHGSPGSLSVIRRRIMFGGFPVTGP
jgi:hypothetical protein